MLKQIISGSYKFEKDSQQSSSESSMVAPGQNLIKDYREKDLDKIIQEAKRESRYPCAQNGLLFAFLKEH